MTRGILILLVVLAVAGGLGALIASDPGYVLVVWGNASLETSLWFGLILLALLWLLLRTLFGILRAVSGGPGRLQAWQHRRQDRRARDETSKGLLALTEGEWARARKELDVGAALLDNPLVNQLGAARAAHELGDASGCERYLEEALAKNPKCSLAVGITRAELQIADQHWEQALATLLPLRKEAPRNGQVLRMLRTVYEALQDWQALVGLLPDLRRARILGEEDAGDLERQAWRAELNRSARVDAGPEGRLAALEQAWNRVPKPLRREPELVEVQVRELRDLGAEEAAEELLRATLPGHWNDALVKLYGWVQGADPATQLAEAEAWLSERPNNPTLLLTLGRLAMRHHEWDKSREYLEASVGLQRSAEAEAELGRLLLHLGDHEAAALHFADGMREFRTLLPDLPLPERT